MKLTGWYSGDQKPLPDRVGPYKREYPEGECYCWWDGEVFGASTGHVDTCMDDYMCHGASTLQSLPWQGVEKPE